ncbi:MAG: amino acid adenylation domain-containing protein [Halanaerobiales bacterium]|nr:amino acid adenylation domain-containing protein [Halanaerobiales bacterium]
MKFDLSEYDSLLDIFSNNKFIYKNGINFIYGKQKENFITYEKLYNKALCLLFHLQKRGFKSGDELIFQLEDIQDFVCTFWACIMGKIIPVPISVGRNEESKLKLTKIYDKLNNPYVITTENILANFYIIDEQIKENVILIDEIRDESRKGTIYPAKIDDIAFIQFSSGSTGDPKGVILTHKSILTTVNAMINGVVACNHDDVYLSWMPLTHDLGIIGWHITPIFATATQHLIPTNLFITNPRIWLEKVSEHKATLLVTPNFALNYYLKSHRSEVAKKWDLSSVRMLLIGAEPVSIKLCKEFSRTLNEFGWKDDVMRPAYGIAEATLGVTIASSGSLEGISLDRRNLLIDEKVQENNENDDNSVIFANIGKPMMGCNVRITNKNGKILKDNKMGYVEISGDNVTKGYYNDEILTKEAIKDGWLNTGDLGFMRNGELTLTGRAKDIIFVNGQNFYPHDIERVAQEIPGIELNKIAVCGVPGENNFEKIICFIISRKKAENFAKLAIQLKTHISNKMGIEIYKFIPVKNIPKTTSGKTQRYKLATHYLNGEFDSVIEELDNHFDLLESQRVIELPTNEGETKLVKICANILEINQLSITDNLLNVGFNSLKLGTLLAQIHMEFGVEMPISEIFQNTTIQQIANYIDGAEKSKYSLIENIENANGLYPASSAQTRIYAAALENEHIAYNQPYFMLIEGTLDSLRFANVLKKVIQRHESFRTSFKMINDELIQQIHSEVEFVFPIIEVSENEVDEQIDSFVQSFELSQTPLFRVNFLKIGDQKHIFMFDMHHIITDGWSIGQFADEVNQLYRGNELPELQIQYKDFTAWQSKFFETEFYRSQEKYWLDTFADEIPILNLPTDRRRPEIMSFNGDRYKFRINEELTCKLNELAVQQNATLYMILNSFFCVLMAKYSGQEDFISGVAVSGRQHPSLQNLIGMFVNILAVRNTPKGEKKFTEFLIEMKENLLKAYENQDYQFDMLVNKLGLQRSFDRNPLVDVVFVLQNTGQREILLDNLRFTPYEYSKKASVYDITLNAFEIDDYIQFDCEYCTDIFDKKTIKKIARYFTTLIENITNDPEQKNSDIQILSKDEKQQILFGFNDTKIEYPNNKTINQLFEESVQRFPDQIAVSYVSEDSSEAHLTYNKLNQMANQLGKLLREKGVKADQIVGIMVGRSVEMIVGILGILKAGGAYLSIDPEYPVSRSKFILENSKTTILLTQSEFMDIFKFNGEFINLNDDELYSGISTNLESNITSDDLAYVLYTSGSTGNPKGVMIEHKSVCNLVTALDKNIYEYYSSPLKIVLLASYVFDASVQQIFASLLLGHKLFIVPEDVRKDGERLVEYYRTNSIDISDGTPAHLDLISKSIDKPVNALPVKHFIIGGEAMYARTVVDFIDKFIDYRPNITNIYGPAECCVDTTAYLVKLERLHEAPVVPIGTPLANSEVYILGRNQEVLPSGAVGEIYIAGERLARGYFDNFELTEERFVQHLLLSDRKMYRTGDLGRMLPDGIIEFVGRIDYQVKIRGFRIELGEIEAKLLKHESVTKAIVIDRETTEGNKYLCAYIVSACEISVAEIKEYLASELPEYMIPAYFVQVAEIPLTINGKIDRKSFPEPVGVIKDIDIVAPENEVEEKLVEIWCKILDAERIGTMDNFFELGGHSLNATLLVSKVNKLFGIKLPLRKIFTNPTIKEQAKVIEGLEKKKQLTIEKIPIREYYPVSSAQKRLFLLKEFGEQNMSYNAPDIRIIEGELDLERLTQAFNVLLKRHDAFRTSFTVIDGEVVQKIAEDVEFAIPSYEVQTDDFNTVLEQFIRPFDLSQAPLLRVEIIKFNDQHLFMFDIHHIISDGLSMEILYRELKQLYEGIELAQMKLQYKDFAVWQNKLLKSNEMKKHQNYWLDRFEGEIPVLDLPIDYLRPVIQSFDGDDIRFSLDREMSRKLKDLAIQKNTTLFMILLAAFNVLLAKQTNQEDIIIGSPIVGRRNADLSNIIGMFVNTLAFRNYPTFEKIFTHFLEEVKENTLSAFEHQDYQFEMLVEKLDLTRDLSRNPLFDVVFTLQNTHPREISIECAKLSPYQLKHRITKFDMTLNAFEAENKINFVLEYATKLFKHETIEMISTRFLKILRTIAENPELKIVDIEIISEKEKNQILFEWNNTSTDYPKSKTLAELFEEQVERDPDQIALVFREGKMTYQILNEKANQLAAKLRTKGVAADKIVGMLVEPSIEMLIGILGILKAGGAYLPIDPEYPKSRIEYILQDSETDLIMIQNHLSDLLYSFEGELINLEDDGLYTGDVSNFNNIASSDSLAYVMYTSGTTGKPKGNLTMHYNISRVVKNTNYIEFTPDDRVLQLSNYCFDGSTFNIFGALLNGSTLVGINKEEILDPMKLGEFIRINKITVFFITAAMFNTLVDTNIDCFTNMRRIIFGGERGSAQHVSKALQYLGKDRLLNGYGPTESTVFAVVHKVNELDKKADNVLIGQPISNTQVYIVDQNNRLQPIGVVGELCISGDGLARGYLNQTELSAEKFVINPFVEGTRMYRTGDLARWLPNGVIQFIGRKDNQVKIRGFRIELEEIEFQLLQHNSINEAIVIARDENVGNSKYLTAYIVTDEELSSAKIRKFLSKELPQYMIPTYLILLDRLPLTPNGKVDRRALPIPEEGLMSGVEYVAPSNDIEIRLVNIWKDVLGVQKVGLLDNFFDLGGHSLKATMLVSKVHKEFQTELQLKEIFNKPTVKELAEVITATDKKQYSTITPINEQEYYPTSSAQKRLLVIDQLANNSITYNMPLISTIKGNLDKAKLTSAFQALIQRHESLRTSFTIIDGESMQKIHQKVNFTLSYQESEEDKLNQIVDKFVKPFDLTKTPLLRAGLVNYKKDCYLFMVDMHHIISDGVSTEIIFKDLFALYDDEELPALRIQYKDFANWQNEFLQSDKVKKQEEFWMKQFEDNIPVLNLPIDYSRPSVMTFEGDSIINILDEKMSDSLRTLATENDVTLYMLLLTVYNILLAKYANQKDIIIGTPIAGRRHADIENIIGMFVNSLALRNYINYERSFTEFLSEVKENTLQAFENQDYQFEMLVDKLNLERDTGRNPLFNVMFAFQNANDMSIYGSNLKYQSSGGELKFSIYNDYKYQIAKFDLLLVAFEADGKINFKWDYSTVLYKKETIEQIAEHFIHILEEICKTPEKRLEKIQMISAEEREEFLYTFNKTRVEYPKEKVIHELFREQVYRTPDHYAVTFGDDKLTYSELNEKSNQLAHVLKCKGVVPDKIVGIMVDRSLEMLIGILGILKAGGAYLPIDPDYPENRIKYILDDSDVEIVLSQKNLMNQLSFTGELIDINDGELYKGISTDLEVINGPKDLAYIIYTSGSTGNPKGVMVEHRGVINYITWASKMYLDEERCDFPLYSSLSFDLTVTSIYVPLLSGNTIVVQDDKELLISKIIKEDRVQIIKLTPAHLKVIKEIEVSNTNLKRMIVGGEALTVELAADIHHKFAGKVEIYNEYGPTETVVGCMIHKFDPDQDTNITVPIGTPADNVQIYLLDQKHHLVAEGVTGEIYISGDGVARGYINKPELVAQRFMLNPFMPGEKMYKTGDLGRRLPNGKIEFLGRIDNQVKIRGYRIELGEIESHLLKSKAIDEAIVIARNSGDDTYLTSYIVQNDQNYSVQDIKEDLNAKLPEYMIPTYFIQMDRLPLTPNGKIDKKALPNPEISNTGENTGNPRNELEEKLIEIWKKVLGRDELGIYDNFFELGGHSLKATQLLARIFRDMNIELSLLEIFNKPTIAELAEIMQVTETSIYSSIEPVEEREYYPLSSAQKRIYIMSRYGDVGTTYNMPMIMTMYGHCDYDRFVEAWETIVERHETFRTSFEIINKDPVQIIHQDSEFSVGYREANEKEIDGLIKEFIRSFDLSKAPLLRVQIVKVDDRYLILFDTHHIIADGLSFETIFKEVFELYQGEDLPDLRIQYKDFAVWQNELLDSGELTDQEDYWLNQLSGQLPELTLVTDYRRPDSISFAGDVQSFKIEKGTADKLNYLSTYTGTTLYMVLMAAYNVLFFRMTGQTDIIVGTAVAGRPNADLENIVGMFVNMLPLRHYPTDDKTFEEFLLEVQENTLTAFENQDYPFEMLIDKLNLNRETNRNPIFNTVFNLQNFDNAGIKEINVGDIRLEIMNFDLKISKFDLGVYAFETEEGIELVAEYRIDLFKPETIQRMMQSYIEIIQQISVNENIKLADIDIMTEEEREILLTEVSLEGLDGDLDF